jgi:3-oxoacyl-[acyl-carrier protein] reductase
MKGVLITGAAGGLGRALVEGFLEAGWRVAAGWHRAELKAKDPRVQRLRLDVTRESVVRLGVDELLADWGTIDCLVNNAGMTIDQTIPRLDPADWDRVSEVNLTGMMRCCRAVLPGMQAQRDGQIVNIGSFAARAGPAGQAAYAAAKAGVIGFSQSLAREAGTRNVRVNVVLPGVLRTPMTAQLSEAQLAGFAQANVLGRLNTPAEVARFVVFLVGLQQISGQVFQLDSRIGRWT